MDIYVQKNGQQLGPFPEAKIRQGIDAGEFAPADLAWTNGKASWQPLSSLIHLDTTKPPPPPPAPVAVQDSSVFTATPVDFRPEQGYERKEIWAGPINVPQSTPLPLHANGPLCKVCGAPYNRWSLFHKLGSGLCRRCAKAHVPTVAPAIWQKEVKSNEDAYKVIRVTAIYFVICAAINFCTGFVWMPILVLCAVGTLWHSHSRVAVILLIVLTAIDILFAVIFVDFLGKIIAVAIDTVGINLCTRSFEAVRKLRDGSIQST